MNFRNSFQACGDPSQIWGKHSQTLKGPSTMNWALLGLG